MMMEIRTLPNTEKNFPNKILYLEKLKKRLEKCKVLNLESKLPESLKKQHFEKGYTVLNDWLIKVRKLFLNKIITN